MMAVILCFISTNYRYLHKVDESLKYLDRSIQAFRQAHQFEAFYYLLAYKTRLLQGPNRLPEAKRLEGLVNQFMTRHANSRQAALIAYQLSWYYVTRNQLVRSFEVSFKANAVLERQGEVHLRPFILENLGYIYTTLKAPKKALAYYKQAAWLLEKTNNQSRLAWMYNKVAFTLIELKRFDEANDYIIKAKRLADTGLGSLQPKVDLAKYYDATGQRLMGLGHYQQAVPNLLKALQIDHTPGGNGLAFYFNFYLAQCYQKLGNFPASISYGLKSYQKAIGDSSSDGRVITLKSSQLLVENYQRQGQPMAAYPYLKTYYLFRKAMDDQNAANRLAEIEIQTIIQKAEQDKARLEQSRLLKEKENLQQRWWLFSSAAALVCTLILLSLLYRNNQHKQRANSLLNQQKQEIERHRSKAEKALQDLKVTQDQLIQKEKLANLGELTAGIAHEIQNPLNFVINYSEVSADLLNDQKLALVKSDFQGAQLIADDLIHTLHKILHHGNRASSIVNGMLEHSRLDSGEKRPINLNALANECFKLAFHGLRAKDTAFNCQLVTELDTHLDPVTVDPQEIGRVLLNLYNNAFYAVRARQQQSDATYQPTVIVTTAKTKEGVQISVSDNGIGMPESVMQKIFQPFFTTKPNGEGTGLGLSLSYDIVTKGHGGLLRVESQMGVGSVFTIQLPQADQSNVLI
ncbi:histidine kinase [Dyadobacter flavalbus]|uniref:histidine kinase n=2 Tax=Dyadobacter flavalbus TaxID=2579942 RepID=A0A5M8QTY1_9BACT|nr:histidine kinase [Dyadobacter flavalbus]